MLYGTIDYDPDGEEYIGRIFLKYPEHLKGLINPEHLKGVIMYTESDTPSTYINDGDWHLYEGKEKTLGYQINGKYYPEDSEELDDLVDDWGSLKLFTKIDVYDKGKLINTYYE